MDPMSITSSIQTICDTVGAVIRLGKRVYHAPAELDILLNEIADIKLLVCHVEEIIRSSGGLDVDGYHGSVVVTLSKINDLSLELETLVKSELTKPTGTKVNRVAFLTARKKLEQMQSTLQSLRKGLREGVGDFQISRIAVEIREITSNVLETKVVQAGISQASSTTARDMAVVLRQLEDQKLRHATTDMLLSELKELVTTVKIPESSTSTGIPHPPPDRANPHKTPGFGHHIDDGMLIRAQYRPWKSCQGHCSCVCHLRRQLRTSGPLRFLIGTLFIGYVGLPRAIIPCSVKSCERQRKSAFYVTYQFPTWWVRRHLAKMLFLAVQNSSLTGTRISFQYPRIVDDGAMVFEFASQGDILGLARLFDSGWATPLDVENSTGRNVLNIATLNAYHKLPVLMFLLRQGADPYLKDHTGSSAAHNLLALALKNGTNMFGHFLDVDATADEYCFPELHKSVLGLINTPIEDVLQNLSQTTATVNDVDAFQRTALVTAVWRNDLVATKILLQYGADPNLGDEGNSTPLHFTASNADTPDCAVVLLNAGANVNATTHFERQTPLMFACQNPNDPKGMIARLLVKSADKKAVSKYGLSAVHSACGLNGSIGALKILIEMGYDINAPSHDLETPIMTAIMHNNTAALQILLSLGAVHTNSNSVGCNLLHYLAQCANFDTIQVFKDAQLSPMDIYCKNKYHQTPLQIATIAIRDVRTQTALDLLLADHENRHSSDLRGSIRLALTDYSPPSLKDLLAQPDAYRLDGYHGSSLTQYIGFLGDASMFSILKAASVSKINLQAKNMAGKTARDYLIERKPTPSPETIELFDELCETIKQNTVKELSLSVAPAPLQWAIIYNDHECLRRRLDPAAILEIRKLAGTSVLHFAASFADEDTMEILSSIPWPDDDLHSEVFSVTIGINGDDLDSYGYTARSWFQARSPEPSLHLKSLFDNLDRRLQKRQQTLRCGGTDGEALQWAISYKDHELVKTYLLRQELNGDIMNESPLILHALAFNGDYRMIKLVKSHLGTGLDTKMKDNRERTPMEVLDARSKPAGPLLRKAFTELIAEAEAKNRRSQQQVRASSKSKPVTRVVLSLKIFAYVIIVALLTLLLYSKIKQSPAWFRSNNNTNRKNGRKAEGG